MNIIVGEREREVGDIDSTLAGSQATTHYGDNEIVSQSLTLKAIGDASFLKTRRKPLTKLSRTDKEGG